MRILRLFILICLMMSYPALGSHAQDQSNSATATAPASIPESAAAYEFSTEAPDNRPESPLSEPPTPPPTSQGPATSDNPYDNVPDAFIEESDSIFEQCTQTPRLNRYYNCACLSVRYLDTRIERGPSASKSSIMLALRAECKDATEAAGDEYNKCMGSLPLLPLDVEPKTYCECVANTFSTMLEESRVAPGSSAFFHIRSRAMLICQSR